jgi:hypothetical protein
MAFPGPRGVPSTVSRNPVRTRPSELRMRCHWSNVRSSRPRGQGLLLELRSRSPGDLDRGEGSAPGNRRKERRLKPKKPLTKPERAAAVRPRTEAMRPIAALETTATDLSRLMMAMASKTLITPSLPEGHLTGAPAAEAHPRPQRCKLTMSLTLPHAGNQSFYEAGPGVSGASFITPA